MSTAWQNGSTKKPTAFRKFLETQDVVIDELPPGTFAESGTGVGAVMLTLRASATADACTNEVVAELA
jgi:rRNA pseudouridine-1189 N-methylase Emg1 (Nep1/Mra1 family)